MNILFIGLSILGISVIVLALFLLLKGDGSREQKLMQYFLMGSLIQNAGYLLELTAPTVEAALTAVKIQYVGFLTIPIRYCHFIFCYCYLETHRTLIPFRIRSASMILIFSLSTPYSVRESRM